jgi:beta-glucosidase
MKFSGQITILLVILNLCIAIEPAYSQTVDQPIYKNPSFPVEQRIDDLISRMTLEEKVGQMNIPTCYNRAWMGAG